MRFDSHGLAVGQIAIEVAELITTLWGTRSIDEQNPRDSIGSSTSFGALFLTWHRGPPRIARLTVTRNDPHRCR